MVELPLSRLTSGKGVARSLQSDLVVGVDSDGRQSALAATRLADTVGSRRVGDRRLSSERARVQDNRRPGAGRAGSLHRLAADGALHGQRHGRSVLGYFMELVLLLGEERKPVVGVGQHRLALEHGRGLEAVVEEG